MSADLHQAPRPARRRRRGPADHVRDQLSRLAGGMATIRDHAEKPWASITFSGARHTLTLVFEGPEAVAAGETLIAELPDHEFAIPTQLVADAQVTAVEHTLHPAPRMAVVAELLLLDDA